MRKLFKSILMLTVIFAIAGLVFVASHKIKTAQAYSDGSLVKVTGNPNIYVINNGMKVWVRSINVFNSCSYNWAAVQNVASINYLPKTANLIKVASNPDVYRLEKNFKRKFRSAAVLDSYNLHWEDIATVCPAVLDSYSTTPLFKDSSARVYKVGSDFVRHLYNNMETFYADGMSTKDIIDVNDSEIFSYDVGTGVPNTTTKSITVDSPSVNQAIKSPVRVSGRSNTYEPNVGIKIKDANGNILADTFTTGGSYGNQVKPFSKDIVYSNPLTATGYVEVFQYTDRDQTDKVTVPVSFSDYQ